MLKSYTCLWRYERRGTAPLSSYRPIEAARAASIIDPGRLSPIRRIDPAQMWVCICMRGRGFQRKRVNNTEGTPSWATFQRASQKACVEFHTVRVQCVGKDKSSKEPEGHDSMEGKTCMGCGEMDGGCG